MLRPLFSAFSLPPQPQLEQDSPIDAKFSSRLALDAGSNAANQPGGLAHLTAAISVVSISNEISDRLGSFITSVLHFALAGCIGLRFDPAMTTSTLQAA